MRCDFNFSSKSNSHCGVRIANTYTLYRYTERQPQNEERTIIFFFFSTLHMHFDVHKEYAFYYTFFYYLLNSLISMAKSQLILRFRRFYSFHNLHFGV